MESESNFKNLEAQRFQDIWLSVQNGVHSGFAWIVTLSSKDLSESAFAFGCSWKKNTFSLEQIQSAQCVKHGSLKSVFKIINYTHRPWFVRAADKEFFLHFLPEHKSSNESDWNFFLPSFRDLRKYLFELKKRKKRKSKKKKQLPNFQKSVPAAVAKPSSVASTKSVNKKSNKNFSWAKLGFDSYADYLRSDTWKEIRERILRRDKFSCVACGKPAEVVHHKCYDLEVMQGDNDYELVSLCHKCHRWIEFSGDKKNSRKLVRKRLNEAMNSKTLTCTEISTPA